MVQWLIDIIFAKCKEYTDQQIALQAHVPSGTIVIWPGTIETIPAGWALCDGTQGTPDLGHVFIKFTDNPDRIGDYGGSIFHDHVFTPGGHGHDLQSGSQVQSGTGYSEYVTENFAGGDISEIVLQPPFVRFIGIMKL